MSVISTSLSSGMMHQWCRLPHSLNSLSPGYKGVFWMPYSGISMALSRIFLKIVEPSFKERSFPVRHLGIILKKVKMMMTMPKINHNGWKMMTFLSLRTLARGHEMYILWSLDKYTSWTNRACMSMEWFRRAVTLAISALFSISRVSMRISTILIATKHCQCSALMPSSSSPYVTGTH